MWCAFEAPLDEAHDERQRNGHGEIEEGDDVVGFEELEGAGRIDLAELGDVLHAERRDQRRILDHRDEVVAERRQDDAEGLRPDDVERDVALRQAEGDGRLDLAARHRLDAGAEDLGEKGRVAHREGDDGAPGEVEIAHGEGRHEAHMLERGGEPVGRDDDGRGADEGDVEQEDEDRDAADQLGVEGRELHQHGLARGAHQRDGEPEQHGEDEGDEGDPQRGHDAPREGAENLAVALIGDDGPGRQHADEADGEQPEREVGEAPAGRFAHESPAGAALRCHWAALYS